MNEHTPTVLIAEDDTHVRMALTMRLKQAGFAVVPASDGAAALAAIDDQMVDAAILDIMMPATDGFGVCEHIRAKGCAMPVFFLTGATDGIVRNNLGILTKAVGGNRFLTKPYDGRALADLLWEALKQPTA